MDDQVPLAQLEEAVDRPRFVGAAARLAAQLGAPEKLLIAEDDQAFRHQAEAVRHVADAQFHAPAQCAAGLRQQLGQPRALAFVVAGDQHLLVAADHRFQLGKRFGPRTGEPFDRLDAQMAGRVVAVAGNRGDRQRRKLCQPLHRVRDAEQSPRILHPVQIGLPLFDDVGQLAQRNPSSRRQRVDQTLAGRLALRAALSAGRLRIRRQAIAPRTDNRQLDLGQLFKLALRLRVEAANRLDLVAKQFDANRIFGVRGKQVENAAVHAEFAGNLDRRHMLESLFDQPPQQRVDVERLAHAHNPRSGHPIRARRDRLQQGGNARDHHPRRISTSQSTQNAQPSAVNRVAHARLLRERFPGGKDVGSDAEKTQHVGREIVDFRRPRQHDQQRAVGARGDGGGRQRAR